MSIIDFLVLASIIPSILLMRMVYKKDKIEKEPIELLLKIFGFGALSVLITLFVGFILDSITLKFLEEESAIYVFINAFFLVALVEEMSKFVMLKASSWNKKEFNYTYDAIVYSVFCSLGFATVENILYVLTNGFLVAILRAFSAVPAHMTFGVFMGIYYGRAKFCEKLGDNSGKRSNLVMAIVIPMLLHGLYDYCIMANIWVGALIFVGILVFLYIYMFKGIDKYAKEDKKININENSEVKM